MKYVQTFERFVNEGSANESRHFFSREKGWGHGPWGGINYAADIIYDGGKLPVLIQPTVFGGSWVRRDDGKFLDPKIIGSEVTIFHTSGYRTGNYFKYTDLESVLDLISGIKEVIKLIPTAWNDFDKLSQNSKRISPLSGSETLTLEKLAPAKTVDIDMLGEPKGKKSGAPLPEGEQAAVIEEIKKVFPRAYDIDKAIFKTNSSLRIIFTIDI